MSRDVTLQCYSKAMRRVKGMVKGEKTKCLDLRGREELSYEFQV